MKKARNSLGNNPPKPRRVFVVRHGETDYNRNGKLQGRGINAPLNELGREQARAVAEYFKDTELDYMATSSLLRAKQTAKPLAEMKKIEPETFPELDEIDFGIYEGEHAEGLGEKLTSIHKKWRNGDLEHAAPEGEHPKEVFGRADGKIAEILSNTVHNTLLFVVHGRLIRILMSEWLGLGLHRMDDVEHANGAIYEMLWENGRFEPVQINYTDHLGELSAV